MKLRLKITLIISITIASLLMVLYYSITGLFINTFEKLESHELKVNVLRVKDAIFSDIDTLGGTVSDWSIWDDAYFFIDGLYAGFIDSNIQPPTFKNLGVDFIIMMNKSLQIVHGSMIDDAEDNVLPLSRAISESIAGNSLIADFNESQQSSGGILLIENTPVLFASHQILRSNNKGPGNGALVMGKKLTPLMVAEYARKLNLSIEIIYPDAFKIDAMTSGAIGKLIDTPQSKDELGFVSYSARDTYSSYSLFRDIYGRPSFAIRLVQPRFMFINAEHFISYFLWSLVVFAIVFCVLLIYLLRNYVLSRLEILNTNLMLVFENEDLSVKVDLGGSDEITDLASNFNKMLGRLNSSATELRESESRLKRIMTGINAVFRDVVRSAEGDFRLLLLTENFSRLTGYSIDEYTGREAEIWERIIHSEDLASYRNSVARLAMGEAVECEYRIRKNDLTWIWVYELLSPRIIDGRLVEYFGVCLDMSERKRMEDELRVSSQVFQSIQDGIIVLHPDGMVDLVNPYFQELLGYKSGDVICKNVRHFVSMPKSGDIFRDVRKSLKKDGNWKGEVWMKTRGGDRIPQWVTLSALKDSSGKIQKIAAVMKDLTERKMYEEWITRLAYHDPLTDLPNRLLFQQKLEEGIALAERGGLRLAVIMLDLDNFKKVNDIYGHNMGDVFLKECSIKILMAIRNTDTLARMGGDEFTVLIPKMKDEHEVAVIAKKIKDSLHKEFVLHGHSFTVSASMGVSIYPDDGLDMKSLMKNADDALYLAKKKGRDRFCFAKVLKKKKK